MSSLRSTVNINIGDRSLTLPARSVTVVLRLWAPSARASGVKLQRPSSSAIAVPSTVSPS
ncbi:SD repeat-containing cell surface domain protein [Klebsiella michiganensis]|nr:SD repeat-containing cell surface domain protein [Klebsiella michiganensis]